MFLIEINACRLSLDYINILICLMLSKNILFNKMTDAHLRPPHHHHHKLASLQVPFANWQVVNVVFNYPVIKLLSVLFVLTKDFHPTPLLILYGFSPFFGFILTERSTIAPFFLLQELKWLRWLLSHFISWAAIIGNAVRENDLVPVKRLSKAESKRSKTRCSGKFCILHERKEQRQKV